MLGYATICRYQWKLLIISRKRTIIQRILFINSVDS